MPDIKVRVGQQNTVKILSSVAGGSVFADNATNSVNVIGGIASVTQLSVSGVSTFTGISSFANDLYIGANLYVTNDVSLDEIFGRNIIISGIGTISTLQSTVGIITNLSNTNLNVSGITTLSNADISNANISISSISQLYVSGVSTFVGVATFLNNLYVDGDLYVSNDLVFDEFNARNGYISGILTVAQSIYYSPGQAYGIAYFDANDQLVSTGTTSSAISETNYILSTNASGIPTWSNVIDGGSY
jgi:hypothetical protein